MDSDYLSADRQTEAKTASLRRVEGVEEALLVGVIYACAGICDRYGDMIACSLCRCGQNTAPSLDGGHRFDCIAHEIEHDLLNLNAIRFDIR